MKVSPIILTANGSRGKGEVGEQEKKGKIISILESSISE
jgi:hypothetical protein